MASKSKPLTPEELASLLKVANRSAVLEPPAIIPSEHRARLIGLGYMANRSGRLRMTTAGRRQAAANQAAEEHRFSGRTTRRGGLTSALFSNDADGDVE